MKVLLDTDIGTNIDDVLCLAYLLAHPECDLLGVTTVTGQARLRAEAARWLCRKAGMEVPVLSGLEHSLSGDLMQAQAPLATALADRGEVSTADCLTTDPGNGISSGAVGFLERIIRQNPGEVVVFTIGPLTNIAALFMLHEEIPRLIKGMVSMAGVFFDGARRIRPCETNVSLDPLAARRVFSNPPDHLRIVGLDATLEVKKSESEFASIRSLPILESCGIFFETWFAYREEIIFHDPLAGVTLFHPEVCRYEEGAVDIEIGTGSTAFQKGPARHGAAIEVASSVNSRLFFDYYRRAFG